MKTRYPIYCNKDLLGEVGHEVPYDKVRNGTWTLDEYLALTTDLYAANGNGVVDNKDTFGYTVVCDTNINSFMQASEIYVVTRHDDGPNFDWDYYNSYVIQPVLLDDIRTLHPVLNRGGYADRMEEKTLKRARRYAAVQERLVAPDGSFPAIGRSITYRTGAFQTLGKR